MTIFEWVDQNYWFITAIIQSGVLVIALIVGYVMGIRDKERMLEREEYKWAQEKADKNRYTP